MGESRKKEPGGVAQVDSQSPPDENCAIVAQVIEAFNRGDLDAVVEHTHPAATLVAMTSKMLHHGEPYVGHEGLRQYFDDAEHLWHGIQLEPTQLQSAGDAVVVLGYVRTASPTIALELPVVWTWKLKDGLITECVVHSDERAARRALGIDDQ